jgi:antitoxin (DNA-binding transcriptional repressor) of toxin-antitoxin stability system
MGFTYHTSQLEDASCTEMVAGGSALLALTGVLTKEQRYNREMADHVIHISEAEAARSFADVLARVRAGAEVVIESGKLPVAVVHAPHPARRTISECIALLPEDSTAVMDADFAKDVEAAIESHREPLEPPAWD